MPEPTTTSAAAAAITSGSGKTGTGLAALFVAFLGPLAGPYALIVFAALAGSLWPLSGADAMTRTAGAWLMLRCTLTAVVLTAAVSNYIQTRYEVQAGEAFAPVAFLMALENGVGPYNNQVKVTLDGTVIFDKTVSIPQSYGVIAVGYGAGAVASGDFLAMHQPIQFESSLLVEIASSSASSSQVLYYNAETHA